MSLAREISTLDFKSLIGKPLNAVINAQAQAAQSTLDFVHSVGLDENGVAYETKFTYNKETENGTSGVEVNVPLLTILPIPYIQVKETNINFNVNLSSATKSTTTSASNLDLSLSLQIGRWKMSGSYSREKNTSSGVKVQKKYSLNINVRAVQDDMPAGLERILDILESTIKPTN